MGGMGGGEEVDEEAPTHHYMHIPIAYRRDRTRRDAPIALAGLTSRFPLHNRHVNALDSAVDNENESIRTIS